MTDYEALRQVIASLGLEQQACRAVLLSSRGFTEEAADQDEIDRLFQHRQEKPPIVKIVSIGGGEGYGGFFASFFFDDAGKVLSHGLWE